jgi:superkiller protein 8
VTSSWVITVAGDSSVKLWDIGTPEHPLVHEFPGAHPLGAHHVAVNTATGIRAASAGFGGEIILWNLEKLEQQHKIKGQEGMSRNARDVWPGANMLFVGVKGVWAVALSPQGDRLAASTCDGKINIWDTSKPQKALKTYETKGSFGLCVDIVSTREHCCVGRSDVFAVTGRKTACFGTRERRCVHLQQRDIQDLPFFAWYVALKPLSCVMF